MKVLVSHPADAEVRRVYAESLGSSAVFLEDLPDPWPALERVEVLATFAPEREIRPEYFEAFRNLHFVQCLAAGKDRFPVERFVGCTIEFNQGAAAGPVAEHAVALALAAAKRLLPAHRDLAEGHFNQRQTNRRMRGSRALVVGLGGIGREIARLLQCLGCEVWAINRSGRAEGVASCGTLEHLSQFLPQSDIVILAIELNAETEGLLGAQELGAMKPDAILVNVARGRLIDEDALFTHLRANPNFTACLDAWWVEPLYDGRFELRHPLFDLPNIVGSPHNAGMVPGIFADLARAGARKIAEYLAARHA